MQKHHYSFMKGFVLAGAIAFLAVSIFMNREVSEPSPCIVPAVITTQPQTDKDGQTQVKTGVTATPQPQVARPLQTLTVPTSSPKAYQPVKSETETELSAEQKRQVTVCQELADMFDETPTGNSAGCIAKYKRKLESLVNSYGATEAQKEMLIRIKNMGY